jgi:hypothetical protein
MAYEDAKVAIRRLATRRTLLLPDKSPIRRAKPSDQGFRGNEKEGKQMAAPKPGDKIYVETTIYVHHGADDFMGGICTVAAVHGNMVEIEEDPGTWYRWEGYLEAKQEQWRKEYGEQKGRLKPDFRPEFNDGWPPSDSE